MIPKYEHRYELYKQGLRDIQIAEAEGVMRKDIASWRQYFKLPNNGTTWRTDGHVPMEEALDPDQCKVMRLFLSSLREAAATCRDSINVGGYMHTWHKMAKEGKGVAV